MTLYQNQIDLNSSHNTNSDHLNDVASCIKYKKNNKIAAYDIDFKSINQNVKDIDNNSKYDLKKENSNLINDVHQSTLRSKQNSVTVFTNYMYGYNKENSMERNNIYNEKNNKITFKSKHYLMITLLLLLFTLLPLQYHSENFYIQIKKMQDYCNHSKGFFYNNQTYIIDTIFPYGFSSSLQFDKINHQLNILNKKTQNNFKIKYMNKEECKQKNLTNLVNIVNNNDGVKITKPYVVDSRFVSLLKIKQKKNFVPNPQNVILICENENFKIKKRSNKVHLSQEYINTRFNELSRWNISCKSLNTTTATISYSQITFISGEIIGGILFSILSDYIGRKKVYLATLYMTTIVGSIASIILSYKQFVFVRFPIAGITKGCHMISYVLLFEMIINKKSRYIYCTLFIAGKYFWNASIGMVSIFFEDWRYMQLTFSLLASLAISYPWLINESFKWLIVRENYVQAEKVCREIFNEENVMMRLIKLKLDDQSFSNYDSSRYWPVLIWQKSFRKIISIFVLIWSILSLINFFINEEVEMILKNNIFDYSLQNMILFIANTALCLIYFLKLVKRFSLGFCMVLSGIFYIAFSVTQTWGIAWLCVLFLQISRVFISFAFNILILYVCELFPCEIRCSSLSFFISIKKLSEMFAIYIFKVSYSSIPIIRVTLSVCCIVFCLFAFFLPEHTAFSFNLDLSEYLNNYHLFKISSLATLESKTIFEDEFSSNPSKNTADIGKGINKHYLDLISMNEKRNTFCCSNSTEKTMGELNLDDRETYLLANSLIKKINCENHCKKGKLNPLYEEDSLNMPNNLTRTQNTLKNNKAIISDKVMKMNSQSMFRKINFQYNQQSSTKF